MMPTYDVMSFDFFFQYIVKNPRVVHCRKPVERWKLSSHLTFNSYVPCKCTICQCIKETVPCKKFLHGGDTISCEFQLSIEGQKRLLVKFILLKVLSSSYECVCDMPNHCMRETVSDLLTESQIYIFLIPVHTTNLN